MRVIFPEDIPQVNSLEELKQSTGMAIWPCIAPETLPRAPVVTIGEQPNTDALQDSTYLAEEVYQGNGWAIGRIPNVLIRGDLFQTENGDVLALAPWWHMAVMMKNTFYRGNEAERVKDFVAKVPSKPQVVFEEPTAFFQQGPHTHWLFEGFLPLAVWPKIGFMPHLVHNDPNLSYRQGLMDIMEVPKFKNTFVYRDTHDILCKDFWFAYPWRDRPTLVAPLDEQGWTKDHKHCYDQNNVWWLNSTSMTLDLPKRIGAKASPQKAKGEKIFVRREGTAMHRLCINEAEAAKVAEKHGFVSVNPSVLNGEEEAATFHQARVICGSSGGGINNVIFSKPGTKVICIGAQDDFAWPLQAICLINQLDLTIIRAPQFSSMDRSYHGSLSLYVIDLIAFDEYLSTLD